MRFMQRRRPYFQPHPPPGSETCSRLSQTRAPPAAVIHVSYVYYRVKPVPYIQPCAEV